MTTAKRITKTCNAQAAGGGLCGLLAIDWFRTHTGYVVVVCSDHARNGGTHIEPHE